MACPWAAVPESDLDRQKLRGVTDGDARKIYAEAQIPNNIG